jgi:hypothetical protein
MSAKNSAGVVEAIDAIYASQDRIELIGYADDTVDDLVALQEALLQHEQTVGRCAAASKLDPRPLLKWRVLADVALRWAMTTPPNTIAQLRGKNAKAGAAWPAAYALLETLRIATAAPLQSPRLRNDEANVKARRWLIKNPRASSRWLAEKIGCSPALVVNLDAWKAVQERHRRGHTPRPSTVSLTPKLQATTYSVEDATLAALTDEQAKDHEPSPLDVRRTKVYRRS